MRIFIVALVFSLPVLLLADDGDAENLKQQLNALKQKIEDLEKEVAERDERIAELEERVKRLKSVLQSKRPSAPEPTMEVVAEGRVFLYNAEKKMVVVTLGSAHGLRKGDTLHLFRDDKEIGKLRVCVVLGTDSANAEVVTEEGEEPVVEPAVGDVVRLLKQRKVELPTARPEVPLTEEGVIEALRRITDTLATLNKRTEEVVSLLKELGERIEKLSRLPSRTEEPQPKTTEEKKTPERTEKEPKKNAVAYVFSVINDEKIFFHVGEKNDVKAGDVFVIYRNTEQIAKAVIVNVYKDLARALVLEKKKGVNIQERDLAVRVKKAKESP